MGKKTIANMQVKIGGDAKELQSSFSKAQKGLKTFAVGMAAVTATVAAAFAGLTALTNKAAEYADTVDKGAIKTGLTRKTIQELAYVSSQAGLGFDKVEDSLKDVAISMGNAAAGAQAQVDAYKKLGIEVTDSNGKLKSVAEIYPEVISKLSEMTNETERNVLGTKLMGESAMQVVPKLAALGKNGIAELSKKAHDLNLIMSGKSIATLVAYKDNMSTLKQQMTQTVNQAMVPFANKFNELTPAISRNLKALGDWISIPVSRVLRDEQFELNALVTSLGAVWKSENERKILLKEISDNYPALLEGMNLEKVKLGEIKTKLEEVNKQYIAKVRLALIDEDVSVIEADLEALKAKKSELLDDISRVWDKLPMPKDERANLVTLDEMVNKINNSLFGSRQVPGWYADYKQAIIDISTKTSELNKLKAKHAIIDKKLTDLRKAAGILTKEEAAEAKKLAEEKTRNLIEEKAAVIALIKEWDRLADLDDAKLDVYINYKTKGSLSSGVKKFDDIDTDELTKEVDNQNEKDAQALLDKISDISAKAQDEIKALNLAIGQGIADLVVTFADGFGQILTGDIDFSEFFNKVLSQFGGFLKKFGEMLIAYGIAEQAFMASMDPFTKIAAGVALVVIGAAITSLGSSGPGGSGSTPATSASYGSYTSANTSGSIPSGGMAMPTNSGGNHMVLQIEMETVLRSDHIALMAKKGQQKIIRRG